MINLPLAKGGHLSSCSVVFLLNSIFSVELFFQPTEPFSGKVETWRRRIRSCSLFGPNEKFFISKSNDDQRCHKRTRHRWRFSVISRDHRFIVIHDMILKSMVETQLAKSRYFNYVEHLICFFTLPCQLWFCLSNFFIDSGWD